MKLQYFLRDKWLSVTLVLLAAAFSFELLCSLGAGKYTAGYITAIFLLAEAAALSVEYFQKKEFYRNLLESLDKLDKKYLLSEMLSEPSFTEGKILYETERETNKSMNDEIAKYKLESKEYMEYIETWVHEIKTPIAACELIAENNPDKVTRDLKRDFIKIENYVEQALFYARSGSVEKDYVLKKTSLRAVVNSALKKNAAVLIESGVKIETSAIDKTVFADIKWTDFIIGQIMMNSIKYRKGSPVIKFIGLKGGSSATLVIEDNGIGIPEKDLGRVFEKGFTGTNGRNAAKSTGIGLYLCKKLCDKMNLAISAASLPSSGTAFSIVFPVSEMHGILDGG